MCWDIFTRNSFFIVISRMTTSCSAKTKYVVLSATISIKSLYPVVTRISLETLKIHAYHSFVAQVNYSNTNVISSSHPLLRGLTRNNINRAFYFSRLRHNRHEVRRQTGTTLELQNFCFEKQQEYSYVAFERLVRIFLSQCIFIIRVSITSEEYPSHRSLIPQDKKITRKATFECKRTKT